MVFTSQDTDERNEIESILPKSRFDRKGSYAHNRSMSVSAASSYNKMNPFTGNDMLLQHGMNGTNRGRRGQGRAMSMQINSNPFIKTSTKKQEYVQQKRRKSLIPRSAVIEDEIVPLTMNQNKNKKRKQRDRYMSVPTNLMSDNVTKKKNSSVWINDYEDSDFWSKELKILRDAGFEDEKQNLSMLIKYAVKNNESLVDKRLTQSIVVRMLEKQKTNKLQQIEEEKQNEKEADSFLENEWDEDDENML